MTQKITENIADYLERVRDECDGNEFNKLADAVESAVAHLRAQQNVKVTPPEENIKEVARTLAFYLSLDTAANHGIVNLDYYEEEISKTIAATLAAQKKANTNLKDNMRVDSVEALDDGQYLSKILVYENDGKYVYEGLGFTIDEAIDDAAMKARYKAGGIELTAYRKLMQERTAQPINAQLVQALKEAIGALSSINYKGTSPFLRYGTVFYGQTDEWCEWIQSEVLPKIRQALANYEAAHGGGNE